MTAFQVKFYGGPLAGQTHMIDNPPSRYQVPSYTHPIYVAESPPAPLDITYEIEEYQLGPPSRGGGEHCIYTWINPSAELRKRIKDLARVKD